MGSQALQPEKRPRFKTLPAEREGETAIYRSGHIPDDGHLVKNLDPKITTLHDILVATTNKFAKNKFLGWRENGGDYKWATYEEVLERAKILGSGLVNLGLKPQEDKVGILSINRLEWNITEHACNAQSLCLVPLYDTLGKEACLHILNECELSTIVCSADKVNLLLEFAGDTKSLKNLVQYETVSEDKKLAAKERGIILYSFEEIEQMGKDNLLPFVPPSPEHVTTICYTSGTTGLPKGVLLSHANIVAAAIGLSYGEIQVCDTDVHISYLPSAHVFERVVATIVMMVGGSMGYYSGDVRKLFDDINTLKPTVFVTVPRLLGRLYDKVMEAVTTGGITQAMFERAYADKLDNLRQGYLTHSVYDPLVFSKIKTKLGGNVRFIITGSAPLAPNLMDFLRVCFCCPVFEGYGSTETCCGGSRTLLWDTDTGHVGAPMPSIEIKLVDVPEMKYFSTDERPRGEICLRGPTCTTGYYRNPEKTKELIDGNGWLHSGDVGCFLPNGNLQIIDRVKNIFKLAHGEYVAPEKVEQIFTQSKWVAQAFVYGESLKASVIAVVVPDADVLQKWAEETNHPNKDDLPALCANETVNKLILDDLVFLGKKFDLKGFELPKKIHLSPIMFSVDNDILTPTFKLKRPQAKAAYKDILDALYQDVE